MVDAWWWKMCTGDKKRIRFQELGRVLTGSRSGRLKQVVVFVRRSTKGRTRKDFRPRRALGAPRNAGGIRRERRKNRLVSAGIKDDKSRRVRDMKPGWELHIAV